MEKHLYELSHFRDEDAYEEYLEKIRRGKNYQMYKELAGKLWIMGLKIDEIKEIVDIVDKQTNDRNGYHYDWYAANARRAIELVIIDTELQV